MMQLVAAIFGKPDFSDVTITLRHNVGHDADGNSIDAVLRVGTFLNALISLALTGLVLFAIVKIYNNMRRKQEEEAPGPTEVELLTQIRDELRARG